MISCLIVVPSLVVSYSNNSVNTPSLTVAGVPVIPQIHIRHNIVTDWAYWNYTGYQGKSGWPEFSGLMTTMTDLGERYGCGRAMWEYNSSLDRFGTPESLMVLPMWTDGCINSMEGLLFESSSSTPYHFLNQAELSVAPSEAMAEENGLEYGGLDIPLGIQHLQLLGVKFFMASSEVVEQAANADPALERIATSGPWHTLYEGSYYDTTWDIYLVHDSQIVTPLANQPVVLQGVGNSQAQWLPVSTTWYANPSSWNIQMTQGGPANWIKVQAPFTDLPKKALPPVQVSDITQSDAGDQISFNVNRVGVPVLVKVSYFPDWHATGADGPWRSEPNLMVVVPTSHHVVLSYGSSGPGNLGGVMTVLGVIALLVLLRRRSVLTVL